MIYLFVAVVLFQTRPDLQIDTYCHKYGIPSRPVLVYLVGLLGTYDDFVREAAEATNAMFVSCTKSVSTMSCWLADRDKLDSLCVYVCDKQQFVMMDTDW